MDYWELINDLCDKNNLDCYVYEDGDNEGEQVLQACSWKDVEKLNELLKGKFEELGIDTSEVKYPDRDDGYVDFATNENWVFSDESFVCDGCYKLHRTGDYYANYFVGDCFILCEDCVKDDPEEYINFLINEPNRANTLLGEDALEDAGFEKIGSEYENGWYGQCDDPKKILNEILERYPDAEVIFNINKTYNPFAIRFTTYIRHTEEE